MDVRSWQGTRANSSVWLSRDDEPARGDSEGLTAVQPSGATLPKGMSRQAIGLASCRYPPGRHGVSVVRLRIAVLAPISWRTPPVHYGPWELFASLLTEGLVERGHDVTLFATGDSRTGAKLSSVVPRGWSEDPEIDTKVAECLHIAAVFERAGDFDVIHN